MIRVQELTAGYGEKQVISCLSFLTDSLSGPLVLAGPNGAGKSTLLKAILNQIPYSGKIDSGQTNQSIGWIPQTFQI
ncbi:MAG: ATP-binding cassette domain-containing protein, partial [Bacteroidetes bacterium]|nr:ATP-binding cassette domain-containing protein [Bacteroidota bacterium]